MEIGISTASFFTKDTTEDALKILNDMKVKVCEVFLTTFSEYLPEFGELLVKNKGNLRVHSVHTLNQQFEPELFNVMERTRRDAEFFIKQAAVVGGMLGAEYYTFHGPARLKKKPYVMNFDFLGPRCNQIDDILNETGNGLKLTYENVHWAYYNYPEFFGELKKKSRISACLDIKQAMQSGYSAYDYLDNIGDRLATVHLCDYNNEGKLCLPGKGTFDFVKLFKRLISDGFDGAALMEVYAGDYKSYDEILASYKFLQDCLLEAKGE